MKKITLVTVLFFMAGTVSNCQKNTSESNQNLDWINKIIKNERIENSPVTDIKSFIYKEKLVFLVNYDAGCCDHFSATLFDEKGNNLGHPFGGISGKGDMKLSDLLKESKEEKMIWVE